MAIALELTHGGESSVERLSRGDALRHVGELQRRLERAHPLDLTTEEAAALQQVRETQARELDDLLESVARDGALREQAIRELRENKLRGDEQRKADFKAKLKKRFAQAEENAQAKEDADQRKAKRRDAEWMRHANAGREAKYHKRVQVLGMVEGRDQRRARVQGKNTVRAAKNEEAAENSATKHRLDGARRRRESAEQKRDARLREALQTRVQRLEQVKEEKARQRERTAHRIAWGGTPQLGATPQRILPPPASQEGTGEGNGADNKHLPDIGSSGPASPDLSPASPPAEETAGGQDKPPGRAPLPDRTAELAYLPSFGVLPFEKRIGLFWNRESLRQQRKEVHTRRAKQQHEQRRADLEGKLTRIGAHAESIRLGEIEALRTKQAEMQARSQQLLACKRMQQQQAALLRQQQSSDKVERSERRREEKLTERAKAQRSLNLAHLGVYVE